MTDKWTDKRDYTGEKWNDLLEDYTRYAKNWERKSGPHARRVAQVHRDSRWKTLDRLNQVTQDES